jgi:hypothetical protein
MDRKTLTIILAVALLAAFFLPWSSGYAGKFSGFDVVTAKGAGWKQYTLLLIPLSALLLLLGSFNGNYALGRGLLCILPFLAILFMLIVGPLIDGMTINNVFKSFGKGYGVGLWVTIVSSLVLAFYNPPGRD